MSTSTATIMLQREFESSSVFCHFPIPEEIGITDLVRKYPSYDETLKRLNSYIDGFLRSKEQKYPNYFFDKIVDHI